MIDSNTVRCDVIRCTNHVTYDGQTDEKAINASAEKDGWYLIFDHMNERYIHMCPACHREGDVYRYTKCHECNAVPNRVLRRSSVAYCYNCGRVWDTMRPREYRRMW